MRTVCILAMLLAMAAGTLAQTTSTASPKAKSQAAAAPPSQAKPAPTAAGASEPVITIANLCGGKRPAGAACKTVITKGEFESIVNAVRPNLPPQERKNLAQQYADLLIFATEGEKLGLQNTPEFQEQLKLRRLQMLAIAFRRALQEKYSNIPDAELEKYYNDNKEAYEEVTVRRLFIPKPVPAAEKDKKPLDEAALKSLADKMHGRAVAGEDFDKLEQEIFAVTNPDVLKTSVAPTMLGARRRGSLPPQHEAQVFELKAGEVSPVLDDPTSFVIYKVESKRTLPLAEVKTQISRKLQEERIRDASDKLTGSVKPTFNEEYFKVPEPPKPAAGAGSQAAPPPSKPLQAPGGAPENKAPSKEPQPAPPPK